MQNAATVLSLKIVTNKWVRVLACWKDDGAFNCLSLEDLIMQAQRNWLKFGCRNVYAHVQFHGENGATKKLQMILLFMPGSCGSCATCVPKLCPPCLEAWRSGISWNVWTCNDNAWCSEVMPIVANEPEQKWAVPSDLCPKDCRAHNARHWSLLLLLQSGEYGQ